MRKAFSNETLYPESVYREPDDTIEKEYDILPEQHSAVQFFVRPLRMRNEKNVKKITKQMQKCTKM